MVKNVRGMFKVVFIVVVAGMLVACSKKQVTTICTSTGDDLELSSEFVSKGDVVVTQTNHSSMSLEILTQQLQEYGTDPDFFLENWSVFLNSLNGVSYEYEIDGDIVKEVTVFDYSVASTEELQSYGLIHEGESDYISLQLTVEELESYGDVCEIVQ